MTTSIRSFCLAALLAAGSAWAQQQPADNPDNPHATQAKDKQGADVSTSTTHQQIDQAEKPNPDSPQNKDRDRVGSAGMDHDAMMQNATPQMILQKLHMANLEEIEMGKLAEQNGTDRVKAYAKTLQTDHTAADRQVKDLAQKKNITLSDTPKNPEMQKKMDEARNRLSNMKGAEFDRTFANRMSMGHKKLISMAQGWRQNCKDQDVCNLIDTLMPKLQQHAQMADQLKGPAPMGRAPENPVSR
ncbi:MAG: DUF4142 domain-containing protein [Deltaproteobacteria bacterium]|nr:MAG: DUF4142 domain-containing protein [Deltaproteobacteria bacterium]TMB11819.1 MAG: DUF4142 domain-containing protein [Deltaproteobacteria bacterium]